MSNFKVSLELDSSGAITNLNEFEKLLKSGKSELKDIGKSGSDAMNELGSEAKLVNRSLADIRKELKSVTNELAGVDQGSEAFINLSQQAGALKDEINNITQAVNSNAGPAFDNLSATTGNLSGQLSALDFEGAANSLKGLSGQLKGLNFGSLTKGVGDFGKSLAVLGRSLLTNPIFLLAAAIGGIVAATMAWKEASLEVDSVLAENLAKQTELVNQRTEELNKIQGSTEQLRLQGKSQREILLIQKQATAELITQLQTQIEQQKSIRDQQVETARRNQDILTGILKFVTVPIQLLLNAVDSAAKFIGKESDLANAFNEKITTLLFDPAEVAANGDAAIKESEDRLAQLIESQARYQNTINDIDRQAAERREAELAKEDARILEERLKARQEFARRLAEIEEQIRTQGLEAQKGTVTAVQQSEFEKLVIRQKAALAAEELARQTREKEVELTGSALSAIAALTEAFAGENEASARRAFAINKAASIAQAIASTYQGANAIFASSAANPATVLFPAQPFIQAGIAITAGLANVARIAKTKFGDTGGGGGGAPRPSFSTGAGTSTQPATGFGNLQLSDVNNRPAQPRAYVIASDVTSQTEAAQKIADRARL